jgi:1-phosphatidylinositol-3-phosphate 5-kinase
VDFMSRVCCVYRSTSYERWNMASLLKVSHHPRTEFAYRLLSFGKYLELLAYSDPFAKLSKPLCEHTTPASTETKDLMRARSNIVRHYAYQSYITSFSTSPVQDVYEVQIPRIQITKVRAMKAMKEGMTIREAWQKDERAELRLQITAWWKGIKERMNQLEELLDEGESGNPLKKPLPPSPPLTRNPTDEEITPRAPSKPLPLVEDLKSTEPSRKSVAPSISSVSTDSTATGSLALLSNLRQTFNATEQSLYATLSRTASTCLNDARRQFYSTSKAASNRLAAWEKKHTPVAPKPVPYPEPDWWSKGFHALPGGSVIVHEGEWASMISFTLSSSDYTTELLDMSRPRAASSVAVEAGSTAPTNSIISSKSDATAETAVSQATAVKVSSTPGLTSFVASVQALASSKPATSALDPDDESTASRWHFQESLSSQISRKDHPKDGSNIMSLRDVLRNKAVDGTSLASRFSNITHSTTPSTSKLAGKPLPSAFGSASLELDTHHAQGSVAPLTPEATDVFEQILRDADGDDYTLVDSLDPDSAAGTRESSTRSGGASSINLAMDRDTTPKPSVFLPPPAVPPKDFPTHPLTSVATTPATEKTQSQLVSDGASASSQTTDPNLVAAFAMGSLTSTIANAMRFVLNAGQQENEARTAPTNHHSLLAMESPDIDSRPHIRYDCVVGKRLKFSCTVYYAKQFDSLRRRCGVDEILIQSLKKTENWSAEGE